MVLLGIPVQFYSPSSPHTRKARKTKAGMYTVHCDVQYTLGLYGKV